MMTAIFMVISLLMSFLSHADSTDHYNPKVQVKASCQIKSYQGVSWPFLTGSFSNNIDNTTGSVTTLCTLGTFYTVGINNGLYYDAAFLTRRLSDQKGHYVRYGIYSESGYVIPWKAIGTPYAVSLVGTGSNQVKTLYARIPKGQTSVPPGNYQDSLIVTLNF
jgi:spore coat protein U-like protein